MSESDHETTVEIADDDDYLIHTIEMYTTATTTNVNATSGVAETTTNIKRHAVLFEDGYNESSPYAVFAGDIKVPFGSDVSFFLSCPETGLLLEAQRRQPNQDTYFSSRESVHGEQTQCIFGENGACEVLIPKSFLPHIFEER